MAVFYQFQDSGLDDWDRNNNFVQMGFRPGFAIQARELTQMQTISQYQIYSIAKALIGDSGVLDSTQVGMSQTASTPTQATFQLTVNPTNFLIRPQDKDLGYVVYSGNVFNLPNITVTQGDNLFVAAQFKEIQVNPNGDTFPAQDGFAEVQVDTTLNDNANGFYNSGAPGASRYKIEVTGLLTYDPTQQVLANVVDIMYFDGLTPRFMNGQAVPLT
jgi:hypothetical protein